MKVSIITVCLNSEKHIEDTIKSVLNQTYKDIEYIIVDGLSTDNTLGIVEKYKPFFNGRLKIISEKDNGIYDAMNKGIKYSTGEIVGIINSDDWYEKDAVENIVNTYVSNKNFVIYGALLYRKENSISKIQTRIHTELWNGMIAHPTVFIPKNIYEKFGGFDINFKFAADYELMLRLYNENIKFKYISKVIANFRDGGATTKFKELSHKETIEIKKKYGYGEKNYLIDASNNSESKYFWNKLAEKVNKKCYKNIYIYGSGHYTEELLKYINEITSIKINGIIDRNVQMNERTKFGLKLCTLDEIEDKVDCIIISSGDFEYEIYKRILYLKNKIDIIRIYGADSVEEANNIIKDFHV